MAGCGAQNKPAPAERVAPEKPALTVGTTALTTQSMPEVLSASGGVFAWQEATIGAEVSGLKLERIHVDVGDTVKKGQVLATFLDESVKVELAQQEAALAEARATLAQAQANAARAQKMAAASAVSEQELLAAETALSLAQAKVSATQAAVQAQRIRLARTRVVAPDSGVVSVRLASVGQVVNTGAELFRLVRQNRVEWRAEVPAAGVLKVASGQRAYVQAPDGQRIEGRVRQVAPTLSAETRSGLVYIDLPVQSKARPGMFLSGGIILGESQAQVVPGESVVVRDGTSYLMMVDESNQAHALKVRTGRRSDSRVEVQMQTPPPKTWKVITQGAGFLNDGDLVKVAGEVGK